MFGLLAAARRLAAFHHFEAQRLRRAGNVHSPGSSGKTTTSTAAAGRDCRNTVPSSWVTRSVSTTRASVFAPRCTWTDRRS